ncbi:uncharacterized protein LOC121900148 isoform X1 [Thunnus maccoyii]|uniref:uncharacterized protein LOC121900148 isoform X1 n=1 Tax=Thunnus maccoyii TaxID=8240 RepID=UPI001C4CDD85|nr:uncharacterized protein LOC121900148 isoform X1 [Thunnus maccoyii]
MESLKKDKNQCSRTRDIVFFLQHILLFLSKPGAYIAHNTTRPLTVQLNWIPFYILLQCGRWWYARISTNLYVHTTTYPSINTKTKKSDHFGDSACDSPVTMETANHHKLGVTAETGPGRARTAVVTTAHRLEPAELAVRAHRRAASPAVSGRLREQTGGGEEERDERKEERTVHLCVRRGKQILLTVARRQRKRRRFSWDDKMRTPERLCD